MPFKEIRKLRGQIKSFKVTKTRRELHVYNFRALAEVIETQKSPE